MTKANLANHAAFDLDELLGEIQASNQIRKEVTGYLDQNFLIGLIKKHYEALTHNQPDFTEVKLINITEYNFTGADFRGIKRKEFEIFDFTNCDITSVHLDRTGLEFFKDYLINNKVIYQGLDLQETYLGPILTKRVEMGIECLINLNLSNMNLAGTDFQKANIKNLILTNSNIAGCNFIGAKNINLKQFADTIGFENAVFSSDKKTNLIAKKKIQYYVDNPDSIDSSVSKFNERVLKFKKYLADLTNFLDD
jgi:hypothetical protein